MRICDLRADDVLFNPGGYGTVGDCFPEGLDTPEALDLATKFDRWLADGRIESIRRHGVRIWPREEVPA